MMISSGGQVKISKNFKIVYNLLILFVILFVVGNIRVSNIDNVYINKQFWAWAADVGSVGGRLC